MTTTNSAESSFRARATYSLHAHQRALENMLVRMKAERVYIDPADFQARIMVDLSIRRVERDLQLVRDRLDGSN
jgi:hypothetical protein